MITVRLLQPSDIEPVNEFYFKAYERRRSKEKFEWEYQHSPEGPSIYIVAGDEQTGAIAGTMTAIPFLFEDSNGIVIKTAKVEDLLIGPDYRGQGLYDLMFRVMEAEARKKGIEVLWAFTYAAKPFINNGFTVPFHVNTGEFVVDVMSSWRYLTALNTRNTPVKKAAVLLFTLISKFRTLRHRADKNDLEGYTITTAPQTDLRSLLSSSVRSDQFFVRQDQAFLDWRIFRNPYVTFRQYSMLDPKGRIVANMIYSLSGGVCHIVQVLFSQLLEPHLKKAYLDAAIESIKPECSLVRYWGFDHVNDIRVFKSAGFSFSNRGIPFVWRSVLDPLRFMLSRMASQGTV